MEQTIFNNLEVTGDNTLPLTNIPISSATSAPTIAARRLGIPPTQIVKPEAMQYDQKIYLQTLTPPMDIVSPSLIAARDYYFNLSYQLDTPPYSGLESGGLLQMRMHPALWNITQASTIPRRHSAALEPSPRTEMEDMKVEDTQLPRRGSASPTIQSPAIESEYVRNDVDKKWQKQDVKDENFDISGMPPFTVQPVEFTQNTTQGQVVMTGHQIHNPLDPRLLGNIPFAYTTNKLREWGDAYLFNSSTADAFIRAIPISPVQSPTDRHTHICPNDLHRALSDFSISSENIKREEEDVKKPTVKRLVKVKIIPQSRASRPFYMQKYFQIRRLSTGRVSKYAAASPRHHIRHLEEDYQGTKVDILQDAAKAEMQTKRSAVPIHIEYALHRAPLLAAIMLSEHVKRGATIEIPVQFPEVWEEVVEWMYIGSSDTIVNTKVRETIEYFGGVI